MPTLVESRHERRKRSPSPSTSGCWPFCAAMMFVGVDTRPSEVTKRTRIRFDADTSVATHHDCVGERSLLTDQFAAPVSWTTTPPSVDVGMSRT
ncbi:MAG: hypothetical protein U1F36_10335 [Planctomycetota bacterium]